MAIAYRADTGTLVTVGSTTASDISFPGTQPVAGDLVVAGGSTYNGGGPGTRIVTDNQGGSAYTKARVQDVESASTTEPIAASAAWIAYRENVTNAGTFTLSFSTDNMVAGIYHVTGGIAFSGAATSSSLDVVASSHTANTDQASQGTGTTGTTANADSVAIAALAVDNSTDIGPFTVTGYTVPIQNGNGSTNAVGGLAYKILSATGTQTATWAYNISSGAGTNDHAGAIAVFKGSSGAPATIHSYKLCQKELNALIGSMAEDRPSWNELTNVRTWF